MHSKKLLLLATWAKAATATYILKDDYQPHNFFDMFDFFSADDPTYGYVDYQDRPVAQSQGLISTDRGTVYMGVDSTEIATGRGRKSVRIETKNTYDSGLIVVDVAHMPGGVCGAWPAFWSVGPNWPEDGELDIIEGINSRDFNVMAAHTMDGCVIENTGNFKATLDTANCYIKAPGQGDNQGCAFSDRSPNTFGAPFNEIGGGVYATEWKAEFINIWFFPRDQIPEDLNGPHPDPSTWGKPNAQFKGTCDFSKLLKEQRFIFNTALCGGWTASQWASDPVCSAKAPTCEEFVKNNPDAFKEAYWEINYMKVFEDGVLPSTAPASSSAVAPTSSVAVSTPSDVPVTTVDDKPPASAAPTGSPEGGNNDNDNADPEAPAPSCTQKPTTTTCTTYVTTVVETIVRTRPAGPGELEAIIPLPTGSGTEDTQQGPRVARHVRDHAARRHH